MNLFKHTTLNDINPGQIVFVDMDHNFFKIENIQITQQDQEGNRFSQPYKLRFFLDLSKPYFEEENEKRVAIRKQKLGDGTELYVIVESPQNLAKFQQKFEPILIEIQAGGLLAHEKYLTTLKGIIEKNSKKADKNKKKDPMTIPYIETTRMQQPTQQQQQQGGGFAWHERIENPDLEGEVLAQLIDFASMSDKIFSAEPKHSGKEALARINAIFKQHNVDPDLQNELMAGLKMNAIIRGDKSKFKLGSGVVMFGPFGTGKTHIAMEVLKKIFEDVFDFPTDEVNIVEKTGGEDSMYIGAMLRALNRVFMPAFKTIRQKEKPMLLVVDEADKFIKDHSQSHSNDKEGEAGMKNLLNPKEYPGLLVVMITNLEEGELNQGLLGRRLRPVYVDYPNKETCIEIWKLYKSGIFGESEGNITKEQYEILAGIAAGNIGVDAIETFCNTYCETILKNGGDKIEKIESFGKFKADFYQYILGRVEALAKNKINQLSSSVGIPMENEIKRIQDEATEQRARIEAAFKGEAVSIDHEQAQALGKNHHENPFKEHYETIMKILPTFFNEVRPMIEKNEYKLNDNQTNLFETLYRNIQFVVNHFEVTLGEIQEQLMGLNQRGNKKKPIEVIKELNEFVEAIIIHSEGPKDLKEEFHNLYGVKWKKPSIEKLKNLIALLSSDDMPKTIVTREPVNEEIQKKEQGIDQALDHLKARGFEITDEIPKELRDRTFK